jgi:hypothetical protein
LLHAFSFTRGAGERAISRRYEIDRVWENPRIAWWALRDRCAPLGTPDRLAVEIASRNGAARVGVSI